MSVRSYLEIASDFQRTKIAAGAVQAGKDYMAAKGSLKAAFATYRVQQGGIDTGALAKDLFSAESTQAKAAKKFAEWMKKPVDEQKESLTASEELGEAAADFEKKFLASLDSNEVMAARAAKKAFKAETREQLKAGKTVEELQAQVAELSAKTIHKIAYWAKKFN